MQLDSRHSYFQYLRVLGQPKVWVLSILLIFIPSVMKLLSFILSIGWLTAVGTFIEKYVFNDWNFLAYLGVAMLLDVITGIRKAWILKQLVLSKLLRRTMDKCIQYFSFIIICGVIANFEINGRRQGYADWLPSSAFIYTILVECKSVLENIYGIDKKFNIQFFLGIIKNLLKTVTGNKDNTNPDNK